MIRQRSKLPLASLLVLSTLLTPVLAQAATEPELAFRPAKSWYVGTAPASNEVSTGTGLICSIQTEFNNGFIVKLGGSEKWVETMVIDFRQDSFSAGDKYDVQLTVPGVKDQSVSASATKSNVLVMDLRRKKDLYYAMRDSAVFDMKLQDNNFRFYMSGFSKAAKEFERCMAGGSPIAPEAEATEQAAANPTINESIALEEAEKKVAITEITPENPTVSVQTIPYTEKTKLGDETVENKMVDGDNTVEIDPVKAEEPAKADASAEQAEAATNDGTPILMAKQEADKGRRLTEMLAQEIEQNPELADASANDEIPREPKALSIHEAAPEDGGPLAPPPPGALVIPEEAKDLSEFEAQPQQETAAAPEAAPAEAAAAPEVAEITEAAPASEAAPAPVAEAAPAAAKPAMSEDTIQRLRAMAAAQLGEPVPVAEDAAVIASADTSAPLGQDSTAALLDEPVQPLPTPVSTETSAMMDLTEEPVQDAASGPGAQPAPKVAPPVVMPANEAPQAQSITQEAPQQPPAIDMTNVPPPAKPVIHRQVAKMEADLTGIGREPAPAADEPFAQFENRPAQAASMASVSSTDPNMARKINELESTMSNLQRENEALNDELKTALKESEDERLNISSDNWNLERATMRFNEAERQIRTLGEQIQKERAQCSMEKKDLETQLFDPQITSEEQLARLSALESQLAQAQSQLDQQRTQYEQRIRMLEQQAPRAQ